MPRRAGVTRPTFTALRHFCLDFCLDGTDHESHVAQAFLIRRYIAWCSRHGPDRMLREVVERAHVACRDTS